MATTIAGFELPEGKSITDLDAWPPFARWWNAHYRYRLDPNDGLCLQIFGAWLAGAYWQSQRGRTAIQLSPKRLQIYNWIRGYIQSNHESPTMQEIGAHFQMKSSASVSSNLAVLEREGFINRRRRIPLLRVALALLFFALVGFVFLFGMMDWSK